MLRNSACEGWVVHRRCAPQRHEFRYPVWMLLVDVDEPPRRRWPWLSLGSRVAPLSVRGCDYPRVREEGATLRDRINARLRREGCEAAERIFLLTQPRSWGWLFNPVSFYFCFRGVELVHVVAEITNTPWNEVHWYVLDAGDAGAGAGDLTFTFPKRFHVSPFIPMAVDYHWRMKIERGQIEIAMRLTRGGEEVFFAGLYLQCLPAEARALRRGALHYPLQNLLTLGRIYAQAFRLWRKRTPFHPHPRTQEAGSS